MTNTTSKSPYAGLSFILNSGISLVFLIAGVLAIIYLRSALRDHALAHAEDIAQNLINRNLATHAYFSHTLKPDLFATLPDDIPYDYFDPVWMSSTYAVREMDTFFRAISENNYYYKEAAINARSPENEADPFEREFLETLNADPTLEERSMVRTIDDKPYFIALVRGESMEPNCLRCHSEPDQAPAGLVEWYGAERSFGREAGEVVSAISIRIPLAETYTSADRLTRHLAEGLLVLLLVLFAVQWATYRRFVLAPITILHDKARQIAAGEAHVGEQIAIPYGQELAELTTAFNSMSLALYEEHQLMEERVRIRTEALALANQRLEEDITQRTQIEKALRQSEEQYRILFDRSLDGLAVCEPVIDAHGAVTDFVILGANASFEEVTRFPVDDIAGKCITQLMPEFAQSPLFEALVRAFLTQESGRLDVYSDTIGKHLSAEVFSLKQGQIVVDLADITEQKRAAEHRERLALVQEKSRILRSFIQDISHEFRTPLTVIHTGLELIERKNAENPEAAARLLHLKDEVMYIVKLVDAMLTMTRLDSLSELPMAPTGINSVVAQIVEKFESVAVEHEVALTAELNQSTVVLGNSHELGNAISKLVENGIQHTPPGGIVTIRASVDGDRAIIEVADTGPGLSEDAIPLIFERFYRTDSARTDRRAGLGLAIAKQIIDLHGGQIQVTSELGAGSIFKVLLPLMK